MLGATMMSHCVPLLKRHCGDINRHHLSFLSSCYPELVEGSRRAVYLPPVIASVSVAISGDGNENIFGD